MKFPGTSEIQVGGAIEPAAIPQYVKQIKPEKPKKFSWTRDSQIDVFGDNSDLDDFNQEGMDAFEMKPARVIRHPVLKVASVAALVLLAAFYAVGIITGAIGDLEPLGPLIGAGTGSTEAEGAAEPDFQGLMVTSTEEVNVHISAASESPVLAILEPGSTAMITGANSAGWIPVAFDGLSGWVRSSDVTMTVSVPVDEPDEEYLAAEGEDRTPVNTVVATNFRTGPSTSYSVIMVVPRGVEVIVTGPVVGGWAPVEYDGHTGFIGAPNLDLP
ncbi:MAG: SH3 domain-containing protein [Promicromonosporaceae bacterium]|nr:SH3 domain-containing protein [Promicromonosporaceae bacterium]